MVQRKRSCLTVWRRLKCWISKATRLQAHARTPPPHTDQYVILIAFPQQQLLRERASLLRYTYIACIVVY